MGSEMCIRDSDSAWTARVILSQHERRLDRDRDLRQLHRRHLVTRMPERGDQPLEMRLVARLAFDVGDEALGRQRGEHALVIHLDDVDLLLVEDARDMEERAGAVLQANAQAREPARAGQIAEQDVGEQARVDIAAAQDQADGAAGEHCLLYTSDAADE